VWSVLIGFAGFDDFADALEFAFVVAGFDGFALVVRFFAGGEGNAEFGEAACADVQSDGDDGEAFFFGFALQLTDFGLAEQEFAASAGFVVVVGAVFVSRNGHVSDPHFAVFDQAPRIGEVGVAGSDAFDFGAREQEARIVLLHEVVLVRGPPIDDFDFVSFARHGVWCDATWGVSI
jgi:hypothetical protein